LLPDDGVPKELVRGKVVTMNVPMPRHVQICVKIVRVLGRFLDLHDIGHLVSNDSSVQTEHNPDSVRGADVAFYSYSRLPRGRVPRGYLAVMPELIFEVRSPTDRWREVLAKVGEYLAAGVRFVCVVDDQTESVHVFDGEDAPRIITRDQELTLPEVLGDFRAPVRLFFE